MIALIIPVLHQVWNLAVSMIRIRSQQNIADAVVITGELDPSFFLIAHKKDNEFSTYNVTFPMKCSSTLIIFKNVKLLVPANTL